MCWVDLSVGKRYERHTIPVPVKVLLIKTSMSPLIGELGLFDEFKITFVKNSNKVILNKLNTGDRRLRPRD